MTDPANFTEAEVGELQLAQVVRIRILDSPPLVDRKVYRENTHRNHSPVYTCLILPLLSVNTMVFQLFRKQVWVVVAILVDMSLAG